MREYRIDWIRRDWVGLYDLDSPRKFGCRITEVRRYVEGEIVQFGPSPPEDLATPRPIVSSRIDPGYIPDTWPGLEPYSLPEHEPEFAPFFGFVSGVPDWAEDEFYRRAIIGRRDNAGSRSRISRGIIEKWPLYIDPYVELGRIKWNRGQREKGRKYLETAWKIARLAFPPGFDGTFDWRNGRNMPVFEAGTEWAKVLAQLGRDAEALRIVEFLFRIDRPGTWSADGIETALLLRLGKLDHLREIAGKRIGPGPSDFNLALLFLAENREEDAVRSVVNGAVWNPLFLDCLLGQGRKRPPVPLLEGREWYAYQAALHTSLTLTAWRKSGLLPRLEAVRRRPHFARALDRAAALARGYDRGTETAKPPWEAFAECFTDTVVEATLRSGVGG